ncbi:MAG: ribonuclease P protein component [Clostridiales bacterium]|nr:ribonuclease P protein component [Clostridiales bacterium]
MAKTFSLKKANRLRKNRDFQIVYHRGRSQGSPLMALIARKSRYGYRVGFTCGKKVGNSVTRNRARRLMKENFRLMQGRIVGNWDMVFVGRAPIRDADFKAVGQSMEKLLLKAGIFK